MTRSPSDFSQAPGSVRASRLVLSGRIVGTLAAAFWLFSGVSSALFRDDPWTIESTGLAILIAFSTPAVSVAWWRMGLGSVLVLAAGTAFGAFAYLTAGTNKGFAVAVTGAPLIVAGVLLLAGWLWSRRPG